jgi:nucleoside-diphosphate-sugar epimerase
MRTFVTGATGVIGIPLMHALGHSNTVVLEHKRPVAGAGRTVKGDIRQYHFGLDQQTWSALADEIDCIVHCAGQVDYSASIENIRDTNITGTKHVLDLARDSGARLVHVSSAFVDGVDPSQVLDGDDEVRTAQYVLSKLEAEECIEDSGVNRVIVRPSLLSGDSRTGEISTFQGMHQLCRALINGSLPLFVSDPGTLADVLPRDTVAESIAAVARQADIDGIFWATCGPAAVSIEKALDIGLQIGREQGLDVKPPRKVDVQTFKNVVEPRFFGQLDSRARRNLLIVIATVVAQFRQTPFPTSLGSRPDVPAAPTAEDTEEVIRNVVRSVIRAGVD